jgi:hypothetical protein
LTSFLDQAGRWFLASGIQEPSGGVARYYRRDVGANAPVSAEITGYAVSVFAYLHSRTGDARYLSAAARSAQYLAEEAWDEASATFPFEPGSDRSYFFDAGIIVRGLVSAWRATGREQFCARAREGALSLAFDFLGDGQFHPIIALPEKQPLPYEPRWSRSPGCYQLKSAMAWRDVAAACGEEDAARLYECALDSALASHESFLAGEQDREKLMDRLHAYCYFLEGLLPVAGREDARRALSDGLERTGALLRELAPQFERSDVSAQLLRARLIAHHCGGLALDEDAANEEAGRAASFQIVSGRDCADPRLCGGFWFGRKGGEMLPFANPVSAAFALQALALWEDHKAGRWSFDLPQLI